MFEQFITEYNEAIFDTDRDRALKVVHEAEKSGVSPEDIVLKIALPAMDLMIKSLSIDGFANIAQHFMTAQISDMVTTEMLPKFKQAPKVKGRVVIGNAAGDLHALGKRIVIGCLRARMLEVKDLGVNVAAEKFVDEAMACDAQVIAISAMMVHTARGEDGCLRVRELLQERGLEKRMKIIVGGAAFRFDHNLYKTVRADSWAEDAVTAGKVIEDLIVNSSQEVLS
jgi:methanogenic corrinoid protein MtbC1